MGNGHCLMYKVYVCTKYMFVQSTKYMFIQSTKYMFIQSKYLYKVHVYKNSYLLFEKKQDLIMTVSPL